MCRTFVALQRGRLIEDFLALVTIELGLLPMGVWVGLKVLSGRVDFAAPKTSESAGPSSPFTAFLTPTRLATCDMSSCHHPSALCGEPGWSTRRTAKAKTATLSAIHLAECLSLRCSTRIALNLNVNPQLWQEWNPSQWDSEAWWSKWDLESNCSLQFGHFHTSVGWNKHFSVGVGVAAD